MGDEREPKVSARVSDATHVDLVDAAWEYFERDRLEGQAEWVRPRSRAQLERLVGAAYKASLRTEEERPVRFQLAYDENPQQVTMPFTRRVAFDVSQLVKMSPAVGIRKRWLVAAPSGPEGDDLDLVGFADPYLSPHPTAQSMLTRWGSGMGVSVADVAGMTLAVLGPGWLRLSTSAQRLFVLRDAELRSPYTVHEVPAVKAWYQHVASTLAPSTEGAGRALVRRTWGAVLATLRDGHHGGALLVLPDGVDEARLPIRLGWRLEGQAIRDALAARLAVEPELSRHVRGREDIGLEALDDAHFLERNVTRVERLIAALTQVDGAVLLRRDLSVVGFGGEIVGVTAPTPDRVVPVARAADGSAHGERTLSSFGMRHRSALRFVESVSGTLAFVVSQDGDVRVFVEEDGVVWLYDGATAEDWVLAQA